MRAGAIAALFLAAASCSRRASTDAEKRAEAQQTVQRFFAALPGQDCRVLGPMLADADCPQAAASLQQHGMRLLEILGAEVDGRDPEAVMVRARMEQDGKAHEMLLRVEHRSGAWALRF